MSNGSVFSAQIAEFVAKAKGNADLVVRKVALEMFGRVIQKSPVDTGRFKSNWQVSINSIPSGTIGLDKSVSHDVDGKEHERGAGSARSAAAAGASLTRVNTVALGAKAGQIIYLVNNLDYALALEYGHSRQAPAGMVRLTIVEFQGIVNQAAATLPK